MYYGYDVDSNYSVIKVNVGAKFATLRENDLQLDLMVGFARHAEETPFGAQGVDELGNEVDVRASWEISKQFAFKGAFAILTGSDLVEQSLTTGGSTDPEDSTWLWYLGFDLRY